MGRGSTGKVIAIAELSVRSTHHTNTQLLVVVDIPNGGVFVKKVVLTAIQ